MEDRTVLPQHQIMHSKRPVLAEFYTESCIPCRQMEPIMIRISKEYTGMLKVIRIDAQKYPQAAAQYGISSVPCLILFKKGIPVFEYPGFISYQSLKDMLEKHIYS